MKKWTKPVIRNIISEFNPSCDCQMNDPGGKVSGVCYASNCQDPANCDCYSANCDDCYCNCDCDCFDIPGDVSGE
ncbi:hypothetical protein NEF87_001138 [Candidatus Lokiarchaeum ossiferum]|uniref:Metallothionein n=1 Tax=Candidatus Lokiarchaeum ossiferum TaxID=2951803 RepID=A0ABY6HNG8_9ARCH|nr:hypothetical protein NEF87_001138 [Candidatus Lokiarchaeum sp. B-35]